VRNLQRIGIGSGRLRVQGDLSLDHKAETGGQSRGVTKVDKWLDGGNTIH